MLLQTIPEGLGLGALLVLVCTIGIHKGAVGMAHLYDSKIQERCVALGLTTKEKIKQNSLRFKLICVPGYLAYVLICVYAINGAQTFWGGFWQCGRTFIWITEFSAALILTKHLPLWQSCKQICSCR